MNKLLMTTAFSVMLGLSVNAQAQTTNGGFQGPGIDVISVTEALKLNDDAPVKLIGHIEKSLGDEKYVFRDASGSMTIEIDNEDWNGINATPQDELIINGEIDKDMFQEAIVDVDSVALKK